MTSGPGRSRPAPTGSAIPDPSLRRLEAALSALAGIADTAAPGNTRIAFTELDRAGRDWVRQEMAEVGLETSIDGCGNVVGRLPGFASTSAIVTGSHVDTVYGGGRFDGTVGVIGAIEAVRCLSEGDIHLAHELRLVCFAGEESNDHGISSVGSRAIAGHLGEDDLALPDRTGQTLAGRLDAAGIDPSAALDCSWAGQQLHAFVELHVEQGRVLEQAGVPIGVVDGIVGIRRRDIEFTGRADHSGTTRIEDRADASWAAAEAILAVEAVARGSNGDVIATTGSVDIRPGAINVVPAESHIAMEARGRKEGDLDAVDRELGRRFAAIAADRSVTLTDRPLPAEPVQRMSHLIRDTIATAIDGAQLPWLTVASWATHDASHMAALCPTGMIFVPSAGGRSHCPEEHTAIDDIGAGVRALTATILALDTTSG